MRRNGSSIFKLKKTKIKINQVSRLSTAVRAKWQFLLCALNKYLNHLPFLLCLLRRHKGFIVNQGKWLKIKLLMSNFVTLASQRLMVLAHHFQVSQSVCTKKHYSLVFGSWVWLFPVLLLRSHTQLVYMYDGKASPAG